MSLGSHIENRITFTMHRAYLCRNSGVEIIKIVEEERGPGSLPT